MKKENKSLAKKVLESLNERKFSPKYTNLTKRVIESSKKELEYLRINKVRPNQ